MAHRDFVADNGVLWTVWTVEPVRAERRRGADRRPVFRVEPDRRTRDQLRSVLPEEMRDGWLAFQSENEVRRLTPSRDDLDDLTQADLRDLLDQATPIPLHNRLAG